MRNVISIIFVMALVLSLAACGAKETTEAAAADGAANAREMPLTTRLVMGTLQLEGTENEVTAEQAAELVPLWKGYVALSASDSTSREELNALAEQISESMTAEQIAFIDDLSAESMDMMGLMEELGVEMPARAAGDDAESGQAFRPGGGMAGMGPGGGQGGTNPEQMSPEQIETMRAERQGSGGGGMMGGQMTTPLVEKLIEILSAKM